MAVFKHLPEILEGKLPEHMRNAYRLLESRCFYSDVSFPMTKAHAMRYASDSGDDAFKKALAHAQGIGADAVCVQKTDAHNPNCYVFEGGVIVSDDSPTCLNAEFYKRK